MAHTVEKDLVTTVLDALGELDLHEEIANLKTALDCLGDASTLAEIRLTLQDLQDAAQSLIGEIAIARGVFRKKTTP